MFICSDENEYKQYVDNLIEDSHSIDIAVAFWGKGASKYLKKSAKTFRILCNLTSGGTNPAEIEEILERGYDVRHCPDLHAKVIVGPNSAIVGSANFSTNGLNIEEEEFDGWHEAGYVTDKVTDVRKMQTWFDDQWAHFGQKINPVMLRQAKLNWSRRVRNRVARTKGHDSILSMTPEQLKGRNVYVAAYRLDPTPQATRAFSKWRQTNHLNADTEISFYEDWVGMKTGQQVISVYSGPEGDIRVDGAYGIGDVIRARRTAGYNKGEEMILHLCSPIDELAGRQFGNRECAALEKRLRKAKWSLQGAAEGKLIPVEKFLNEFK